MSSKEMPVEVMAEAGIGSDVARPLRRDFGGGLGGGEPAGRRGGTLERKMVGLGDAGARVGREEVEDGFGSILISGFFFSGSLSDVGGGGMGLDSGIVGRWEEGCDGRRWKLGVGGADC